MSQGFWKKIKKPIIALAPMANVTDAAFRRMFVECGKPDVFWTEFVSVEGLLSEGKEKLLPDFWFSEEERPIVAQIFGAKIEQFEEIGKLILELGFDGVDINMGCPDRGVEKQGAGAALIKTPELAKEIIRALKRGVGNLPVSVKTRIGYSTSEIETWIPTLLEEGLAALTVHLRTRKEMSDVPARWELMHQIVELRNRYAPETLIIGNGDVVDESQARAYAEKYGVDGVMIGRGMFGNPWLFSNYTQSVKERLTKMMEHTELFECLFKSNAKRAEKIKNFEVMKKHYKAYVNGFDGAKELRIKLMEAENAEEVRRMITGFLNNE